MPSVSIKAYAKLNLGLKILGRRADGFHELRTVFQCISLCDQLEISTGGRSSAHRIALQTRGLAAPAAGENLAVQAAEAFCGALRWSVPVRILLHKRIPAGGGLGGGSSDAAAVLRGLDCLSGHRLEPERLMQIAAQLGSDVPFFLFGGRAIGVGRGEEVYPLPDGRKMHGVVVFPGEGMNTAEAYRLLGARPWPPESGRPGRPGLERPRRPQHTPSSFAATLLSESRTGSGRVVENDFEPVVFQRFPELASAKRTLLRSGAQWAALTGSGSAVFGLFATRMAAAAARRKFASTGLQSWLCRTVRRSECLSIGQPG